MKRAASIAVIGFFVLIFVIGLVVGLGDAKTPPKTVKTDKLRSYTGH